MQLPLTGRCLCGAIHYRITDEPITIYACHCSECQRQSGSAFGLSMWVAHDALEIAAGMPKCWRRHIEDRYVDVFFCADCGTTLFVEPQRAPEVRIVKPGTLDDTKWLHPIGHQWVHSAQPWVDLSAWDTKFERQGDGTRWRQAWSHARCHFQKQT